MSLCADRQGPGHYSDNKHYQSTNWGHQFSSSILNILNVEYWADSLVMQIQYVNWGHRKKSLSWYRLKAKSWGRKFVRLFDLDCLKTKELNTVHMVSVASDRAPSMRGAQNGFVTLLQKWLELTFHCILHREAPRLNPPSVWRCWTLFFR